MTDLAMDRYYELGSAAAQRGEPLDACPYRRPDRVNAWVRGWHAGEGERLRFEAWRVERRRMPHVGTTNRVRGEVA
jgi:ribosome modulation factor